MNNNASAMAEEDRIIGCALTTTAAVLISYYCFLLTALFKCLKTHKSFLIFASSCVVNMGIFLFYFILGLMILSGSQVALPPHLEKIYSYVMNLFWHTLLWHLALVSLNRFVSICFYMRYKYWFNGRNC